MLTSVVDIVHHIHEYSLTHEDPTLVLYDITAAFPSIARDFALDALKAFDAPTQVLTIMKNFYKTIYSKST